MSITDKLHYIDDRDRARYSNDRPAAWERDRSFAKQSSTAFDKDKATDNSGTKGNDWDANNPVERGNDYRYDDEDRDAASYIDIDHSDYNRNNDRYRWTSEDWD